MKFRIKVREICTHNEWFEDHDNPTVSSKYSAKQVALRVVSIYNHHAVKPIELVAVNLLDEATSLNA